MEVEAEAVVGSLTARVRKYIRSSFFNLYPHQQINSPHQHQSLSLSLGGGGGGGSSHPHHHHTNSHSHHPNNSHISKSPIDFTSPSSSTSTGGPQQQLSSPLLTTHPLGNSNSSSSHSHSHSLSHTHHLGQQQHQGHHGHAPSLSHSLSHSGALNGGLGSIGIGGYAMNGINMNSLGGSMGMIGMGGMNVTNGGLSLGQNRFLFFKFPFSFSKPPLYRSSKPPIPTFIHNQQQQQLIINFTTIPTTTTITHNFPFAQLDKSR